MAQLHSDIDFDACSPTSLQLCKIIERNLSDEYHFFPLSSGYHIGQVIIVGQEVGLIVLEIHCIENSHSLLSIINSHDSVKGELFSKFGSLISTFSNGNDTISNYLNYGHIITYNVDEDLKNVFPELAESIINYDDLKEIAYNEDYLEEKLFDLTSGLEGKEIKEDIIANLIEKIPSIRINQQQFDSSSEKKSSRDFLHEDPPQKSINYDFDAYYSWFTSLDMDWQDALYKATKRVSYSKELIFYAETKRNIVEELSEQTSLNIILDRYMSNLDPLEMLVDLEELSLQKTSKLEKIDAIAKLRNLKSLRISEYNGVTDYESDVFSPLENFINIDAIRNLTNIKTLGLRDCEEVESFSPIANIFNLEVLDLSNSPVQSIDWIQNLQNLNELDLTDTWKLTDISPLAACQNLRSLNIRGTCADSAELFRRINRNSIEGLTIGEGYTSQCNSLTSGDSLRYLTGLKELRIYSNELYDKLTGILKYGVDGIHPFESYDSYLEKLLNTLNLPFLPDLEQLFIYRRVPELFSDFQGNVIDIIPLQIKEQANQDEIQTTASSAPSTNESQNSDDLEFGELPDYVEDLFSDYQDFLDEQRRQDIEYQADIKTESHLKSFLNCLENLGYSYESYSQDKITVYVLFHPQENDFYITHLEKLSSIFFRFVWDPTGVDFSKFLEELFELTIIYNSENFFTSCYLDHICRIVTHAQLQEECSTSYFQYFFKSINESHSALCQKIKEELPGAGYLD